MCRGSTCEHKSFNSYIEISMLFLHDFYSNRNEQKGLLKLIASNKVCILF